MPLVPHRFVFGMYLGSDRRFAQILSEVLDNMSPNAHENIYVALIGIEEESVVWDNVLIAHVPLVHCVSAFINVCLIARLHWEAFPAWSVVRITTSSCFTRMDHLVLQETIKPWVTVLQRRKLR